MALKELNSKTMSDVLLELYEPNPGTNFFEHSLSLLERCVPHAVSSYSLTNLETREHEKRVLRSTSIRKLPNLESFKDVFAKHPFSKAYFDKTGGAVLCTEDFMSVGEWKRTEFYKKVHRPAGVLHDTSVRFYFDSECISYAFSDMASMDVESRRFLKLMSPHLLAAYKLWKAREQKWGEGLPKNMILLSHSGSLIDGSLAAQEMLNRYFPEKKKELGILPDDMARWISHELKRLSLDSTEGKYAERLMVKNEDGTLFAGLLRHDNGYLLVLEETAPLNDLVALEKLGLTPREAEVLYWVAEGKQNSDVADILNVSLSTARKHMEHVLHKLGCETRGAAIRTALQAFHSQVSRIIQIKCLTCKRKVCISC